MTSQSEFRVTGVSWKKGVKDDFADIGGTVNQVADDRYLQVGVSGSGGSGIERATAATTFGTPARPKHAGKQLLLGRLGVVAHVDQLEGAR